MSKQKMFLQFFFIFIHIQVLIMISNNLMTTNNKMRKLTANGVRIYNYIQSDMSLKLMEITLKLILINEEIENNYSAMY